MPKCILVLVFVGAAFVCNPCSASGQSGENRPPNAVLSPDDRIDWEGEDQSPAGDAEAAFHELVRTGSATQVVEAINQGADVNSRDAQGRTPLMFASAVNKDPGVISALLKAGASANARSEHGFSPLIFAAASNENPGVLKALLDGGSAMDARNEFGKTALFYACQRNPNPEIVHILIDAGANVNCSNDLGETPLMMAAANPYDPEPIVISLLRSGADASVRSKDGKTAFDYSRENAKLKGTAAYWQLNDSQF